MLIYIPQEAKITKNITIGFEKKSLKNRKSYYCLCAELNKALSL